MENDTEAVEAVVWNNGDADATAVEGDEDAGARVDEAEGVFVSKSSFPISFSSRRRCPRSRLMDGVWVWCLLFVPRISRFRGEGEGFNPDSVFVHGFGSGVGSVQNAASEGGDASFADSVARRL